MKYVNIHVCISNIAKYKREKVQKRSIAQVFFAFFCRLSRFRRSPLFSPFSDSVYWWLDNFCFSFFIFIIVIFSLWKQSVCFTFCVMAVFYDTVKKKSPNEGDGLSVVRKFSAISQLPVKTSPLSVTSKCYSYRLIKHHPDFQKTPASCEASITSVRIGLINYIDTEPWIFRYSMMF